MVFDLLKSGLESSGCNFSERWSRGVVLHLDNMHPRFLGAFSSCWSAYSKDPFRLQHETRNSFLTAKANKLLEALEASKVESSPAPSSKRRGLVALDEIGERTGLAVERVEDGDSTKEGFLSNDFTLLRLMIGDSSSSSSCNFFMYT